jgi:translation initiation factor 1
MAKPADPNTRLAYSTGVAPAGKAESQAREPATTAGPGIRIRLDRRASGRVVTVVTGLPGPGVALATLARELKAACGAGGTVKDRTLELQGDHRDRIEAALDARGLKWKRSGG